jgi:hypothetical protein
MKNPFTETDRFVSPSTNRVRIVNLPGVWLPERVRGRQAVALLSADSLRARIRWQADALALSADSPHLLHDFDHCFTAVSPTQRALAAAIAAEYGQNLGYVLLTLKRAAPVNQAARPEWDAAHWAFWRRIHTVWLGGGLVAGQMGPLVARQAQTLLREAGYPDYSVRRSPYAADLALAGAARHAPPDAGQALLFDFGHSHVKRAIAAYHAGTAVALQRLSPLPPPCHHPSPERQAAHMVEALASTWREVIAQGAAPAPVVVVCLACYLRGGHPPPGESGCYGRLQSVAPNLQDYFSAALSEQLGRRIEAQLLHDAAAAAAVYAGAGETAVLTLGTAVGTGFPPPAIAGLRPLAADVELLP